MSNSKIVITNSSGDRWGGGGQSSWTASGFDTKEEAEEYANERCSALWGYSASSRITVDADGRIVVHMSCWNSCD